MRLSPLELAYAGYVQRISAMGIKPASYETYAKITAALISSVQFS